MLVIVLGGFNMNVGAKDPVPSVVPSIISDKPTKDVSVSYDPFSNGNMPKRIAMSLNDLDFYSDQLSTIQTDISFFHQHSWEDRDIKKYQGKLIEGIENF